MSPSQSKQELIMGEIRLQIDTCSLLSVGSVPTRELGGVSGPPVVRGLRATAVCGTWGTTNFNSLQEPAGCVAEQPQSIYAFV